MIDAVETKANALGDAITNAKGELTTYFNTFNHAKYSTTNWAELEAKLEEGKALIDGATSLAEVVTTLGSAKALLDGVAKDILVPQLVVTAYVAHLDTHGTIYYAFADADVTPKYSGTTYTATVAKNGASKAGTINNGGVGPTTNGTPWNGTIRNILAVNVQFKCFM